jgi:tight adherence protein C
MTQLLLYLLVITLCVASVYLALQGWQERALKRDARRWMTAQQPVESPSKPSTSKLTRWFADRGDKKQRSIERDLPNALDLLRVCIDAGLDLSAAMLRVSNELSDSAPELAKLFSDAQFQINAGASRSAAYEAFAAAAGSREIRNLMMSLAQAEELGSSLSLVLRTYATELRSKRRLRAEDLGAKLSTKLIFPLLLCLFPAMLIVLAGPSLLSAIELVRLLR